MSPVRPATRATVAIAMVLGVTSLAPTVGDIGGCGTDPEELPAARYERARKALECDRCRECSLPSARCGRACDTKKAPDVDLPPTCRPLLQDGTVCLRALRAMDCSDFSAVVDDEAPRSPSECLFCKEGTDASLPEFSTDAASLVPPAEGGGG